MVIKRLEIPIIFKNISNKLRPLFLYIPFEELQNSCLKLIFVLFYMEFICILHTYHVKNK